MPDSHEILVVRTAHEMAERNDWIVPWFNGEPRLNKPPMSYWLTAAVAALRAPDHPVEIFDGRLVSVLAGAVIVIVIYVTASAVSGALAGALGAGLFVTSAGFFSFTHDARPDLLYAMFCFLGFAAFVGAVVPGRRRYGAALIYLMWASYGLAVLTKGPQIPALFLIAATAWLRREASSWQRVTAILRPLRGLLLILAIAGPWWWLLQINLPSQSLGNSQLSGSLLRLGFDSLFGLYYLYHPLIMFLPWLILVGLAAPIARAGVGNERETRLAQLSVWTLVVTLLMLSFGAQQRYYYALPLVPVVFMTAGIWIAQALRAPFPGMAVRAGIALQAATIAAVAAYLAAEKAALYLAVALALGVFALALRLRSVEGAVKSIGALAVLTLICLMSVADNRELWSEDRTARYELASRSVERVPADQPLIAIALAPPVYVYLLDRSVPRFESAADAERHLDKFQTEEFWLLCEQRRLGMLPASWSLEEVDRMTGDNRDRALLLRVKRPQ